MRAHYRWKSNIFSNKVVLYKDDKEVASINDKFFSSTSSAKKNGASYSFKTKGFFKQTTQITDNATNKVIGEIKYNAWNNKAEISLLENRLKWKYINMFNTKWHIEENGNEIINYNSNVSGGTIESKTDNALMILAGLHVRKYYKQEALTVLIILLPIILNR